MKKQSVVSVLQQVTVFKDRAQIFRYASATVEAGEVALVFSDGLWSDADRATLQVNVKKGNDACVLRGVQFKTLVETEDVRPMRRQADAEFDQVQLKIAAVQGTINGVEHHLSCLEAVRRRVLSECESVKWDPKEIIALNQFLTNGKEEETRKLRAFQKEIADLRTELSMIEVKRRSLTGDIRRTSKEVAEVQVLCSRKVEPHLVLTYIVRNASWTPLYDLRVNAKGATMSVAYMAQVQQCTGENWNDVRVELSTANPQAGGDPPETHVWRVSLSPPPSLYTSNSRGGFPPGGGGHPAMMSQQMFCTNMIHAAVPPPPPVTQARVETAAVATSTTSSTFTISGLHSIKANNEPTKVPIMSHTFDVHLRYSTVPKLDSHSYLKVKAVNSTDFVLLPGKCNVFADNQFVGNSQMNLVNVNEEFWTFVGVDDAVSCSRALVSCKTAEKGSMLTGRRTRVEYSYQFKCKNTKSSPVEVVVWDQYPISEDKKIVVVVQTPEKGAANGPRFETNDLNAIEWFYNLEGGVEIVYDYVFYVEYPVDETVTGLF